MLHVQVRFTNGAAAPMGIVVELGRQYGAAIAESVTDTTGNCQFNPPKPDIYFVRTKHAGFLETTTRVDFQSSLVTTARLILKPIPGQTSPAATDSDPEKKIPTAALKEYERGQRALQNHELDDGIAHLNSAIEIYEQFPQAFTLLGTALNEQKHWKDAQAALERAVELAPASEVAYFQLGGSLNQLRDYAGAVKILNRGLQIRPDSPDAGGAHFELAQAYLALGQWQAAEPHAATAVAMKPEFARAHILMGNIDLKEGDGQGAISEFQDYLRLEPDGPAADSVRDMIPRIEASMRKK
ncbi:MAG: tetratricopeptide repeat protein [Candidatus Acidiferrales bacterium]